MAATIKVYIPPEDYPSLEEIRKSYTNHHLPKATINKIRSDIQAMYDAGVPFFTRDSIRDVYEQLKGDLRQGRTISVRGLDGVMVDYDIKVGDAWTRNEDLPENIEEVVVKPYIFYVSAEYLRTYIFSEREAYCNMRITSDIAERDRTTKEFIKPVPSSDIVKSAFKQALEQWESSETCLNLQSTLSKMTFHPDLKITKIVAFACGEITGRFSDAPNDELGKLFWENSSAQHALILTLQKSLSHLSKANQAIQCFMQDPSYTPLDSEVLAEYGVNTLNDPEGFLEVDDTTVIISCAPDIPVKEIIVDIARPAMMFWDFYEHKPEGRVHTDPCSPRIKKFLTTHYQESEFPLAVISEEQEE
ncbi:hypothetical protein MGYG_07293 [Nannizzia gypsea CBS 118893]|uniref:SRR1-like domain-containing protein n=1 Tax=Arthroderma gypseum (strain ATCC MYA-4604 / CBS 118893) TaxID=535722 RepID=E4V2L9_ARTGP|nr:hypothetical protein MGYG_07293 [Nannizzia gypsea CBS 118893]EFR04284.1 hypothetical protein MGYG_07293 [Nannizzia gypsea CBS 118893]